MDYAAATPISAEVQKAMDPYIDNFFANPSAIHSEGRQAHEAIEKSRLQLARILGVRPEGIVYTGTGTESNNLAIYGTLHSLVESGKKFTELEIVTTELEHPSVLEVVKHLGQHGVVVHFAPVDETGRIINSEFAKLLNDRTALISFAYGNSEVGTVQDVKRLTRTVRDFNRTNNTEIKIHLDAAQAPLWLPCKLEQLGVDLLSLDAGKCYGPKGVGMLALRHGVKLSAVQLGGGQERGLRAGTENTAGIVGGTTAVVTAQEKYEERVESVVKLRDIFISQLCEIEGVILNGHPSERLANNVNISIPGIDTKYAVVVLDTKGIACSTKSACSGSAGGGSKVVRAMTGDEDRANSTIRFSLGEDTNKRDIIRTVSVLKKHIIETRTFQSTLTQQ